MTFKNNKITNNGLRDLRLINENGRYYLRAVYIIEDSSSIKELTIDRIELPIEQHIVSISDSSWYGKSADIGYGVNPVKDVIIKTIEEKIQEVTIEDIEKKFGCKVKIVR